MPVKVKGTIKKNLFKSKQEGSIFKIYAFNPKDKSELQLNNYGNITIKGDLPELIEGKEYEFMLEYDDGGKYGGSYNVLSLLTATKPTTGEEALIFLTNYCSEARAISILRNYPNFIEKVINGEPIDHRKINGVGEKTLTKLIVAVKENLETYDFNVYCKEYGLSDSQIAGCKSAYKTLEKFRLELERNPYACLCSVSRIGFKTADGIILLNTPKLRVSNYRLTEAILYCLEQNEADGSTYIHIQDLRTACQELVPECMANFEMALEKSNRIFLHEDKQRVAKVSTYENEKQIAEILLAMNDMSNRVVWKDGNGNPIDVDNIDDKYKSVNGIKLTDKQCETLKAVIENNVVILSGYAGTGKSSSCRALIEWLDDNKKTYYLVAPTGRASEVLSDYTGRQASTIHKLIGWNGVSCACNRDNKLVADIIIVDEASMCDVSLLASLLESLPDYCKILFVCDPAQIPSVGCGNAIQDIIRSKVFKEISLTNVFRYAEGGLSYVASNARNSKPYLTKQPVQQFGDDYVFCEMEDEYILDAVMEKYAHIVSQGNVTTNDIAVISCYNKGNCGTVRINNTIQSYLRKGKSIAEPHIAYHVDGQEVKLYAGDNVILRKTIRQVYCDERDEAITVSNGSCGVVTAVEDGVMYCKFGDDTVTIPKRHNADVALGYSISVHKMQGDSRQYIIFVTPKGHTYMLNKNLVYVALTRAKKAVLHFGDRETLRRSLFKSENTSRQTFLEQIILQNFSKKFGKSVDNINA